MTAAPEHTPLLQVSACVQPFPSLHEVPSASATGFEHCPVDGLHVPPAWQASPAHVTGFEPVHAPLTQVSVCVHAFPSLQAVPFALVDHAEVLCAGSQAWQAFAGLAVPAAMHAFPMMQLLA